MWRRSRPRMALPSMSPASLPARTISARWRSTLIAGQAPDFGSGNTTARTRSACVHADDDPAINKDIGAGEWETVAASATDQVIGATGGVGDYLVGILVIPATTSPGAVSIKDGAGSAITLFTGGASSVGNLVPFFVPLGIYSGAGAWKVTTGANVSAIAIGNFA
jgi:hypothetical protein